MTKGCEFYEEIHITKWKELVDFYHDNFAPGEWRWAFRGHTSDEWHLETSIERAIGKDLSNALGIELRISREFIRRAHHYSSLIPRKGDVIEWFALMQHHGAPTRLLDWTYSFFVGLHFAIKSVEAEKGCALWAIDTVWLKTVYLDLVKLDEKKWRDGKNQDLVNEVMLREVPGIININSLRLTERQVTQQGLFIIPGDVKKSYEENIQSMGLLLDDLKKNIKKLIIHTTTDLLKEIRIELTAMNINEASLFPGLDGFARSLHELAKREFFDPAFGKGTSIFSEIENLES